MCLAARSVVREREFVVQERSESASCTVEAQIQLEGGACNECFGNRIDALSYRLASATTKYSGQFWAYLELRAIAQW